MMVNIFFDICLLFFYLCLFFSIAGSIKLTSDGLVVKVSLLNNTDCSDTILVEYLFHMDTHRLDQSYLHWCVFFDWCYKLKVLATTYLAVKT